MHVLTHFLTKGNNLRYIVIKEVYILNMNDEMFCFVGNCLKKNKKIFINHQVI